jgi:protein TonB
MAKTYSLLFATLMSLAIMAAGQTEQTGQPTRLRVSSGTAEGLKIHDVSPEYPRKAKENHIQGDVILQGTIDSKGKVINLTVVQGDPILAEASIKAVRQWRYRPYVLKGEPVEVETKIKIQFRM